jgi:hypothetical protein
LDRHICIENKKSLFNKYPDFYQQIYGDILIDSISPTTYRCNFVKRVTVDGKSTDYPSYLILSNNDDQWKIITESDLVTDKNIARRNNGDGASKTSSSTFISGLSNANVYSKEQAENGSVFEYSDGRRFKIKMFYEQVDIMFYAIDESNVKQRIIPEFEFGYSTEDNEMRDLKKDVVFLVGQYDFNADDRDELIIAIQDNDLGDNGLSINVFQLEDNNWKSVGILNGGMILGDPKAEIKMNKVRIQRNLRGFYYEWTFESGKFIDTGNY